MTLRDIFRVDVTNQLNMWHITEPLSSAWVEWLATLVTFVRHWIGVVIRCHPDFIIGCQSKVLRLNECEVWRLTGQETVSTTAAQDEIITLLIYWPIFHLCLEMHALIQLRVFFHSVDALGNGSLSLVDLWFRLVCEAPWACYRIKLPLFILGPAPINLCRCNFLCPGTALGLGVWSTWLACTANAQGIESGSYMSHLWNCNAAAAKC